jgi:long-chain acyl-CoA synthetase
VEGKERELRTVKYLTFREFYEIAYNLGRSLLHSGLYSVEPIQKMKLLGIYSKNRFEWLVTDWACIIFGLTTVPLYDTLGIENLSYCLNQTEMTTSFASLATIKTLLKLKDHGKLETIISYDEVDQETLSKLKEINIKVVLFS